MDYVIANSSAALLIMGKVNTLREGADMSRDMILSGKAAEKLEQLVRYSRDTQR